MVSHSFPWFSMVKFSCDGRKGFVSSSAKSELFVGWPDVARKMIMEKRLINLEPVSETGCVCGWGDVFFLSNSFFSKVLSKVFRQAFFTIIN